MNWKWLIGTLLVALAASAMAETDWRLQLHEKVQVTSSSTKRKHPPSSRPKIDSPSHKPSRTKQSPKVRAGSAEPRLLIWDGSRYRFATMEETRRLDREAADRFRPILDAAGQLRADHLAQARALLEPHLHEQGLEAFAATTLAEVCLHEGNYGEALGLIGPYLSDQSDENDSLIAAVAGAMTGNVLPGQTDFCRQVIARQAGGVQNLSFAAPSGDGLLASKVCALLAFAASQSMLNNEAAASRFYQLVLGLAPDNPLASFELGEIANRARNWSQAETRFHVATQHSSGD